jgi:hypothetical protein
MSKIGKPLGKVIRRKQFANRGRGRTAIYGWCRHERDNGKILYQNIWKFK